MEERGGLPILHFTDQSAWHDWLLENCQENEGIWLKIAKKNQGVSSVSYAEALDEGLCFGWIDGLVNKYDEQFFLQKFTPRRPKSIWSKTNTEHIARLTEEGRMQPSGLATVEAARADGRWDAAYASAKNMVHDPAFLTELKARPKAKAFFEKLNRTNEYAIYWRIHTAKKPETKARRIEQIVDMLERGEKLH